MANFGQKHLTWPCILLVLGVLVAVFMAATQAPSRLYVSDAGFFLTITCGYTLWNWQKRKLAISNETEENDLGALMSFVFWWAVLFEISVFGYFIYSNGLEILRTDNPVCWLAGVFFMTIGLVYEAVCGMERYRYAQKLIELTGVGLFSLSATLLMLAN